MISLAGIAFAATPAAAALPRCTTITLAWNNTYTEGLVVGTTDSYNPNCENRPGDNYLYPVRLLKRNLMYCYGPNALVRRLFGQTLDESGYYDDATAGAVRAFQRNHDLSVDSWAGPKTRTRMAFYSGTPTPHCSFLTDPISVWN
ncbi:hypothetical protein GCM10027589_17230 [Actinocorallia lasiicapitis]